MAVCETQGSSESGLGAANAKRGSRRPYERVFDKFSPEKRIEVDLESLSFAILDKLLASGDECYEEIEEAKATATAERIAGRNWILQRKKKLKGESPKDTDLW